MDGSEPITVMFARLNFARRCFPQRTSMFVLVTAITFIANSGFAVVGQNDAPVLDGIKQVVLNSEFQGAGAPVNAVGTLVSRLVDFSSPTGQVDNVTDQDNEEPDGPALLGLAITFAEPIDGTWYYSLNNGSAWTLVGSPSDSAALLLAADSSTRLYFKPTLTTFSGTAKITFRAWDRTSGTAGSTADTSTASGGTNAFSTATDRATVTVVPNIAFRSATTAKSGGTASSSLTITKPTGSVQGDVMIAAITCDAAPVTITAPTGWTLIRKTTSASQTLATYWHAPGASDPSSYMWTFSASVNSAGGIGAFTGVSTTAPINVETGTSTSSSLSHAAPTVTPTLPRTMLLTWHAFASAATWTPPSGMTEFVDVMDAVSTGQAGVALEGNYLFESTSAATGTKTATASNNADTGVVESIALRPLNNAPALQATANPTLSAVNEDAGAPSGAVGSAINRLVGLGTPLDIMNNVTDLDSDTVLGVAITGADTANGTWYYSTNHSTWTALPAVSDSNALLLDGWLYFQPATNFSGYITNAITFRAWDQTSGTSGSTTNITATGNSTAFSAASDTAAITVNGVNDAPTATNLSAPESYTQDIPLNLTDIVVTDIDSTNITAKLTLSNPNAGPLNTGTSGSVTSTYNPATGVWLASGAIADVNTLLTGVTFTPWAGFNSNFTIATSIDDGTASPITGSKAITGLAANHSSQLSVATNQSANTFTFLLTGSTGSVYQIQTSTDLTNWFPWRLITNSSGFTTINDTAMSNSLQFYRSRFVP